jgi:Na+-translocating ferredoxin:NAD+ oxidoreductase subunit A
MLDLLLLLIGAILINNFVLVQFLGLCPFTGVSRSFDNAVAMSAATAFVLTLAAAVSHLLYHGVLAPLGLEYLRIIAFIVVIAALVQLTELYVRATSPVLHQALGLYLPLITTNCAVLGLALLALNLELSFVATLVYACGAALGFSLVLALFAALREQLVEARLPRAFRGAPITLITAGLMSLGFMGFQGMGG